MGSDAGSRPRMTLFSYFNPRSPHGERPTAIGAALDSVVFQSTLPAWGATTFGASSGGSYEFQSTLPAWGATSFPRGSALQVSFQSTLPAWGATPLRNLKYCRGHISIHAPRMGSDVLLGSSNRWLLYFNPRSPHGERRDMDDKALYLFAFQSTLPAWGATFSSGFASRLVIPFQSTLPAWGATIGHRRAVPIIAYFNPRSPHGERLYSCLYSSHL